MTHRAHPEIIALAYIGVKSDRHEDWGRFAGALLGMQRVDSAGGLQAWRMDDRKQRLVIDGRAQAQEFFGWEVGAKSDLDRLAARLESAGYPVQRGSRDLAAARHVEDLIITEDPSGYRLELCWNPAVADTPFVPGRPISGFKTGPLGMGHAVLHVSDTDTMLHFYRDLMGFQVTDYGLTPYPLYFFHVNSRHHSFAMVGSGRRGLHHFMVELANLDDVGQGYDLAGLEEGRLAYTLGRHSNDWMTSFYAHSPSGFFVEYGWGAREIDPVTWEPHETFDGPSYWGHERLYLPPDEAARLREMRLDAARRGLRAGETPPCAWATAALANR